MNNQKDTINQKDIKTGDMSFINKPLKQEDFAINPSLSDIVLKTEKIVTALYMVTECIDLEDPIRLELRRLGVAILSDTRALSAIFISEKIMSSNNIIHKIGTTISMLEISASLGYISTMNLMILKREFILLKDRLEVVKNESSFGSSDAKKTSLSFEIPNNFFDTQLPKQNQNFLTNKQPETDKDSIKDIMSDSVLYANQKDKMSYTENQKDNENSRALEIGLRAERKNRIMKIMKDKKEATIKEVSEKIPGFSEKTIQRELMSLVDDGVLKKVGNKRWSKYALSF